MIAVRLRYLPADSATAIALGGSGWRLIDYLTAHNFHAISGIVHPALPVLDDEDPIRIKRLEDFKKRVEERKEKLASGEIPS